jgi:hypothetical protein
LAYKGNFVPTKDVVQAAELASQARPFGKLHVAKDIDSSSGPAASIATFGKGHIAATYFSFSRGYLNQRSAEMRAFLNDLVHQLFPNPSVVVEGCSDVDVCVNRLQGKLAINLVNTSGPHWDTAKPLIDAIAPVGPLTMTLQAERRPATVRLEPGGEPLAFEYQNGAVRLAVPRVDIHRVVVAE